MRSPATRIRVSGRAIITHLRGPMRVDVVAPGGDVVIINDPAAFRERFEEALCIDPAQVDRIFGAHDREPGQVAVLAADRTVFWMLYRPEP